MFLFWYSVRFHFPVFLMFAEEFLGTITVFPNVQRDGLLRSSAPLILSFASSTPRILSLSNLQILPVSQRNFYRRLEVFLVLDGWLEQNSIINWWVGRWVLGW